MWSSSGSGKKSAQSEMVQVACPTSSASPFWRPPPRDSLSSTSKRNVTSPTGHGSGLIVGAAYSHADMLKFDSL
ncbi:hypothetical protein FGSG_13730 [Fusarium graminearum PH-1]|uniref:hypothetical protein n=1 Tax=Gibberella zeae (strain ATCC MYA-4620 / CBS 123657 / FGSC 9075 / NRRL 31084 / PH-1) TaxID=229533 RepID=UPI00021F124F|nr:hypothetical protein FGSG_13730 [Fusarium graminearum PH-1]ESU16966.1 hypothetical protein FGSG_13730 [Fusarium graminearum PH-1]|eukprot:XP_011319228.1 hypothetical protein FGSG_13730 [Fusarium graminearum PH-1]